MDSKPSIEFLAAPCLALSAALFFLGTGLAPTWALTWLAAIPVLWIAPRLSAGRAFFVAMAAYAIGGLNMWSYSRTVLPTALVAFILLLSACLFGATVLLYRKAAVRGKLWQAALIAPAFWVTMEYAVATLSIHGTFGNLGYSQMDFLPILQVASVTGIWGISFCILLFAATIAALLGRGPASTKIPLALGVAIFLACVFGFGAWRLATTPKDSASIKVGLVASSSPENIHPGSPEEAQAVFQRYADQVKSMAGQGVKLFILPENSGPVTDATQPQVDAFFGQLAKETGAYVAIGVARISPNISWNQERLYSPQGELVAAYNKHHLLPPFENVFTPDVKRAVFNASSGKWGLEICKDMDFPRLSREYSQDGVGLLLVPAWDFVDDGWLHGRMAILRGVEGGFSIARSVKLGILTATDDRGRVLGESKTIGPVFATLVTDVPVRHDATFYSRFGNWFAWLCIVLLAVTLISIFRGTRRESDADNRS
jgi:apolipoprotein N-acyltransferase